MSCEVVQWAVYRPGKLPKTTLVTTRETPTKPSQLSEWVIPQPASNGLSIFQLPLHSFGPLQNIQSSIKVMIASFRCTASNWDNLHDYWWSQPWYTNGHGLAIFCDFSLQIFTTWLQLAHFIKSERILLVAVIVLEWNCWKMMKRWKPETEQWFLSKVTVQSVKENSKIRYDDSLTLFRLNPPKTCRGNFFGWSTPHKIDFRMIAATNLLSWELIDFHCWDYWDTQTTWHN